MYSRDIEAHKLSLSLSDEQREVLVGTLLGDVHLETQNRGRTYRVKFEYSAKHRLYADHLYELFREWILSPPQVKVDASHNNVWFQTVSHPAFRFYAHQFTCDGRKCVPSLIHRFLKPRSIAYWFMDDGSVKSRESKGVLFNTQGFVKQDVERLIGALRRRFQLEARARTQKDGIQIYVSGTSYERFREIVDPYIIPSMRYKIPTKFR
jgi:LAGLIDADG DNA endonuclease family